MNTDPVVHEDDEPSLPLVHWYPRGGPMRSVAPDLLAGAALTLALFAIVSVTAAAVILTRRALAED
jgi:hypothetical protein